MAEFEKVSCIRDFHVYQDNWTPILGEQLVYKMGQVIQEIDMLSQFVKREIRQWGIFLIHVCASKNAYKY